MTRGRIANAQNNQKRSNFIEFYKNRRQSSPEGTAECAAGEIVDTLDRAHG
jgi:hypothetical protein